MGKQRTIVVIGIDVVPFRIHEPPRFVRDFGEGGRCPLSLSITGSIFDECDHPGYDLRPPCPCLHHVREVHPRADPPVFIHRGDIPDLRLVGVQRLLIDHPTVRCRVEVGDIPPAVQGSVFREPHEWQSPDVGPVRAVGPDQVRLIRVCEEGPLVVVGVYIQVSSGKIPVFILEQSQCSVLTPPGRIRRCALDKGLQVLRGHSRLRQRDVPPYDLVIRGDSCSVPLGLEGVQSPLERPDGRLRNVRAERVVPLQRREGADDGKGIVIAGLLLAHIPAGRLGVPKEIDRTALEHRNQHSGAGLLHQLVRSDTKVQQLLHRDIICYHPDTVCLQVFWASYGDRLIRSCEEDIVVGVDRPGPLEECLPLWDPPGHEDDRIRPCETRLVRIRPGYQLHLVPGYPVAHPLRDHLQEIDRDPVKGPILLVVEGRQIFGIKGEPADAVVNRISDFVRLFVHTSRGEEQCSEHSQDTNDPYPAFGQWHRSRSCRYSLKCCERRTDTRQERPGQVNTPSACEEGVGEEDMNL